MLVFSSVGPNDLMECFPWYRKPHGHIYEGCSCCNLNGAGSPGMLVLCVDGEFELSGISGVVVLWVGGEFELSGISGLARFVGGCEI